MEVDKEDDFYPLEGLTSIGIPTGVGVQVAEAPGRMYCGRPKPVNWVVNDQLSK